MYFYLFALTNYINTSATYDSSIYSPFRVENVVAKATSSSIDLEVSYYIDTRMATMVQLTANGNNKNDLLSSTKAKSSLRNIKLSIPNTSENTAINLDFTTNWSQKYTLDGTLFFDNNSFEEVKINESGDYQYKFIKQITFNNKTGKFQYGYDTIDFIFPLKPINKILDKKYIFEAKTDKPFTYKLYKDNSLLTSDEAKKQINSKKSAKPGNYSLDVLLNYRNGSITKKINLKYDYQIEKNLIGLCEDSLYCLEEGEIEGELVAIKKENLVL